MTNQNLLTIFLALTAVAILIQTGILIGFYFVSNKLSRQADQAIDMTRKLFGPMHATVQSLQTLAARIAEFSSAVQQQLRQLENWWRRRPAA
jgi:uncharacterized protein YoxC